jgi:hypothetical protein
VVRSLVSARSKAIQRPVASTPLTVVARSLGRGGRIQQDWDRRADVDPDDVGAFLDEPRQG